MTEAGLLAITEEEEMETELDYIETMDEDKLLSASPTKTSVGSPRRSPRFSNFYHNLPLQPSHLLEVQGGLPDSAKCNHYRNPPGMIQLLVFEHQTWL